MCKILISTILLVFIFACSSAKVVDVRKIQEDENSQKEQMIITEALGVYADAGNDVDGAIPTIFKAEDISENNELKVLVEITKNENKFCVYLKYNNGNKYFQSVNKQSCEDYLGN